MRAQIYGDGSPPPGDLSAFVSKTLGGLRYDLGVVHSAVRMGRCVGRKEGRKGVGFVGSENLDLLKSIDLRRS